MNPRFMRTTSRLLIASVLSLGLPVQSVYAAMVDTDKVITASQFQSERERISSFMQREDVRLAMQEQGVDAAAADARMAALTDYVDCSIMWTQSCGYAPTADGQRPTRILFST